MKKAHRQPRPKAHRLPAPLTSADYLLRLARLQEEMARETTEAVVVTPCTSFRYLTGLALHRSERLIALVAPAKGKPAIICPAFERERLRTNPLTDDVRTWTETEDPYLVVRDFLVERGVNPEELAMEETTEFRTVWGLRRVLDHAAFPSAARAFAACRMRKSPAELNHMRAAIRLTHDALRGAVSVLRPGLRESEFAAAVTKALSERGGEEPWVLAQFGPTASVPHALGGARKLPRAGAVLCDYGAAFRGYQSDITRTFHFGRPTPEFEKVRSLVRGAHDAALAAVRPGVTCESVDAAARRHIVEAGYGEFFIHRTGHGIGLDVHEEPYIVNGNGVLLEPGMTFTIEPGIYLPGKFGVRWENDCLCTEHGGEVLVGDLLEDPLAEAV
ncbi:MAG: aminopeptidase P family protein [Planctomycetes bacterium]|nr:aminopeptidase P family protein [Planctomycetota bacterium]